MASTRNKNSPGDYELEQRTNIRIDSYSTYENSAYGNPIKPMFCGDGLMMGRIASEQLSKNSCDIESQLFGIGANNLVKPKDNVSPEIKQLESLDIIQRLPVFLPEPLVIEPNQRPSRLN